MIVTLASIAAYSGSSGRAASASSKGAILGVMASLAQELAPSIRILALCPGWVDAGFTDQARAATSDPETLTKVASSQHVLSRMATADEVAAVAVFAASNGASFITGSPIRVDGVYMVRR